MPRKTITQTTGAEAKSALADDPGLEMIRARYAHPDWQIGDWAHRKTVANLIAEVEGLRSRLAAAADRVESYAQQDKGRDWNLINDLRKTLNDGR